jgi:subtilisin family serine protease
MTELVYKGKKNMKRKGKNMRKSVLKAFLSLATVSAISTTGANALTLHDKEVKFGKKLSLQKLAATSNNITNNISVVIKVKKALSLEDEDKLYSNGVKSIAYAGELSYYVVCDKDQIDNMIKDLDSFEGIALLEESHKLSQELKELSSTERVEVNVDFMGYISSESFAKVLEVEGIDADIISINSMLKSAKVKVDGLNLSKLAKVNSIVAISKAYEIGLIRPFSTNLSGLDRYTNMDTRADQVKSGAYGLDGVNIKVGVVDVGLIRESHTEFKTDSHTRVVNKVTSADVENHSTHVGGILGGDGDDENAKGVASSAKIYSYSFQDQSFANVINTMYSSEKILLSNHSYGYTDKVRLAEYDSDARGQDTAVRNNPYLNVFMAAGNDGGSSDYPEVGSIKGPANAKNIFTIGALDHNSKNVASYSSVGPVFDGRIKPDLCVRGTSVKAASSRGDDKYAYMSGTSMATPAAAGIAALVMQEYKRITGGESIRHDLLKSLLVNTAVDKSVKGPDIYTGYGMIDAKAAVDSLKTVETEATLVVQDSISNNETKRYSFEMESDGKFKATISWVDMAGSSASSSSLVNDIDMYVVDANGKKYYPYSLNKSNPTAVAFQDRANRVDTIEQVEVDALPSGTYELVVEGYRVSGNTQEFAVATNVNVFSKSNITVKEKIAVNNFARVMLESIY